MAAPKKKVASKPVVDEVVAAEVESEDHLGDIDGDEIPNVSQVPTVMKQTHKVSVGDRVQVNGDHFKVSSHHYEWQMIAPYGSTATLVGAVSMPSPSFLADVAGTYLLYLPTDEGLAEVTVVAK